MTKDLPIRQNDQYYEDRAATLRNRERLAANTNLVFWYQKLYEHQFVNVSDIDHKCVLEIGSGTSPLRKFHPGVLTSDVLDLDYLDFVFDCHEINQVSEIADGSLDFITLTNVLHHLRDPLLFLNRAATKLKPGGKIILTEPYFSTLSSLIYKYLHHEPVVFDLHEPLLSEVTGRLASANQALPHLIFFSPKKWSDRLLGNYRFSKRQVRYFTSIAYMATGGISRKLPVPKFLYRAYFALDLLASQLAPKLFASFFTIVLTRPDRADA